MGHFINYDYTLLSVRQKFHLCCMNYRDNILLAYGAIRANMLRTVLTFSIIAFGIMALVGILTAMDSLKSSIYSNFSMLGSNTFTMRQSGMNMRRRGGGVQEKPGPVITYEQAKQFKERYRFPSKVSISAIASGTATVKYNSEKTNPNIQIWGIDENYLSVTGYEIENGRSFTLQEIKEGSNVILLGKDVVSKIFKTKKDPTGEFVSIGNTRFIVTGILKSKGSSMMSSGDNQAFIPILNAMRNYTGKDKSVALSVMVNNINQMGTAEDEAIGLFRNIRNLKYYQKDDFDIITASSITETVLGQISYVTYAATIIGVITLFGAAIALMNIMLVSVTERTREIGVSKAIGATKGNIRRQFLIEAIIICQIGGALGIILGILIGNVVSLFIGGSFIIPWLWIMMGIIFCFIVGLAAGIYPAVRASNLDPIESLRYE